MNEEVVNIQDFIDALKKRWQLIVSVTLAVTIIATMLNFFIIKPKYESTTKLFIGKSASNQVETTYNSSEMLMYQKMLKTYSTLISSVDLVSRAFEASGVKELNSNEAIKSLSVVPQNDTQIIEIKYTSGNKQECKDVVEAISKEFIKESPVYYDVAVETIESVKLPSEPISPNKVINISLSFVLGLLMGVGISIGLFMMDSTFKEKEKLEEIIGLPVLGVIPDSEKVK